MNPLCTLSAAALARMIRERRVTSEEVVEAHIARATRVNRGLNAVVRDRFDAARRDARAADARARHAPRDELPPLHGVPCSIKEAFALEGMPHTAGLVARRGVVAAEDAVGVARLRAAGAIPLGVTNVSELCMWMECNNNVYGRTSCAYDLARTAGGSSGGEGALVGAGGSPLGLGSDIGGSIRMPAFFNGVFGHKPSAGLVPNAGQFPIAHGAALRYLTTGPLARRAEDLAPALRILADGDPGDPRDVDLRGVEVLDVRDPGLVAVSGELLDAQERAASALSRRGARVRSARLPSLRYAIEVWSALMDAAGGPSFAELLGNGTPIHPGYELLRWSVGRSPHTLPALGLALVEKLPKLAGARSRRFVALGARLRAELLAALGTTGVMLYPSHTRPAPRHHAPLLLPVQWGYTAIFNVLEVPVTQVPLGLNARGLPLGVQVVGGDGADRLTLAVALALEDALGGWVPPPLWS